MSVKQRVVIGRVLLLVCVLFVIGGVQLWSWKSDVHTRERVYAICPPTVPMKDCPFAYESLVTGTKPDHTPAILAFIAAGTAGLLGVALVTSRSTPTTRDEVLVPC